MRRAGGRRRRRCLFSLGAGRAAACWEQRVPARGWAAEGRRRARAALTRSVQVSTARKGGGPHPWVGGRGPTGSTHRTGPVGRPHLLIATQKADEATRADGQHASHRPRRVPCMHSAECGRMRADPASVQEQSVQDSSQWADAGRPGRAALAARAAPPQGGQRGGRARGAGQAAGEGGDRRHQDAATEGEGGGGEPVRMRTGRSVNTPARRAVV